MTTVKVKTTENHNGSWNVLSMTMDAYGVSRTVESVRKIILLDDCERIVREKWIDLDLSCEFECTTITQIPKDGAADNLVGICIQRGLDLSHHDTSASLFGRILLPKYTTHAPLSKRSIEAYRECSW